MTTVIKSGKDGNTAIVTESNELRTLSTTRGENVAASTNGDTFIVASGPVNLTSGSPSSFLFLKNDDTLDWVIELFTTIIGNSTGAPGESLQNLITVNPTSLTPSIAIPAANINLGSPKQLPGTFLLGGEGSVPVGGTGAIPGLIASDSRVDLFESGPLIVAPGTSLALGLTPAAGNTSMNASFSLVVYRKTD